MTYNWFTVNYIPTTWFVKNWFVGIITTGVRLYKMTFALAKRKISFE